MSLFPRTHFLSQAEQPHHHQTQQSSYHPLFRLFDEFDQYSRAPERAARQSSTPPATTQAHASPFGSLFKSTPTFTPKFDVKEVKDGYELHGEFPGIDQKDIEIEFTDSNTLTIKGRTERNYTSGTPPSSSNNNNNNNKDAIESAPGKDDTQDTTNENRPSTSNSDHQPKVEDEDAALSSEVQNTIAKFRSEKQVTKHNKEDKPATKPAEEKYWISERSVGEFERSFSFPVRVDRENVKASMKNGVLSVVVPKAKMESKRRIVIEDASN